MPLVARLDIAGIPQHIIQRGVDRQPCFHLASNYWRYLDDLGIASQRHGCVVHAYALMTNHVHLLVTPETVGAASRMMQQLGRRYVKYYNRCRNRTGTLWEGRFRSCLVDTDGYLLRCQRYIELNPVRAGMVDSPGAYRWSSYRHHAWGDPDPVVRPHGQYFSLGLECAARRDAYIAMVQEGIPDRQMAELRRYTQQGRAWGSQGFQKRVEAIVGREATVSPRGRPSQRK
jgi:putative transposase